MMILHMETASGSAIASLLPEAFVSVGMDVTSVTSQQLPSATTSAPFFASSKSTTRAWCSRSMRGTGDREIGDGTHCRGIVNLTGFEQRFGVKQLAMSLG